MSILNEIVKYKKTFIQTLPDIAQPKVCTLDFTSIFQTFSVIAECKAQSPSAGNIVTTYQPTKVAQQYEQAGADAISVLTDERYFGGSFADLSQVSQTVNVPILCKDFIISSKQVHLARQQGASACLLIAAILEDDVLLTLKNDIESLGMTAVLEVYNAAELTRVLQTNPSVVLINNRNLHDFSVQFDQLKTLVQDMPESVHVISASGVQQPSDCLHLPEQVNGVLIGTALMQSSDKQAFIQGVKHGH